ncbi:aldo/keto reductase [Radicibacter daui]|uniref:aldo/keto reductase n=1 Tax=Radicibacter daui TaxID=3064829 RepID=UPI004046F1A3
MASQPMIAFNDGYSMPQFGLGVWQVPDAEAQRVVKTAIEAGYRLIDTAAIYGNEVGVGDGIAASGIARDELFVTTKLWNSEQGFDSTLKAAEASLDKLALDYVDLYLIHWPCPAKGRFLDTWRAFLRLKEEGRVKSIGVSNFNPDHLDVLVRETGVTPVLNQVELHPDFQQAALRKAHAAHNIVTQSWSPLGQGTLLGHPTITAIAARHGRTPAQIIIRWHLESGFSVIPKSVTESRIRENIGVFDFALTAEDKAAIAALDGTGSRLGPDPLAFN